MKQVPIQQKIRFDGIYNNWDTSRLPCGERSSERYKAQNITFFTSGGKLPASGAFMDFSFAECKFYKNIGRASIGKYEIAGDSIFAHLPTVFILYGMGCKQLLAHYRGYIKNKDTIVDWHIIPPYPVKLRKFVRQQNADIIHPQLIYFMHNDGIKCLDTASYH